VIGRGEWWPARRRAAAGDEDPDASASQRLKRVEKRVGWLYAGLAAVVSSALAGSAAYYRTWETSISQRAAATATANLRLERVERDMAELRSIVFALAPFIRNPPALPALPGDDR
jgi:hypothetical protein